MDKEEFPCVTYTRDLEDWREFIRRSPEAYKAWIDGAAKECEVLELRILSGLEPHDRPVFVDTNISLQLINSREAYDAFFHSSFPVILRDESRSPAETLALAVRD